MSLCEGSSECDMSVVRGAASATVGDCSSMARTDRLGPQVVRLVGFLEKLNLLALVKLPRSAAADCLTGFH